MPPDLALLSTLIGSNYPCLELIFMIPKVFEPMKFDCMSYKTSLDFQDCFGMKKTQSHKRGNTSDVFFSLWKGDLWGF